MTTIFETYNFKRRPYIYHTQIPNLCFDEGKILYINTTTMTLQFIKQFLFEHCSGEDQEKITQFCQEEEQDDTNLITHVIKIRDTSLPKNIYSELLLIDIKNELIPILKENINISSYYSLCRINHTYCMEQDLPFTNIELLKKISEYTRL
jgi:hypothetical protein